MAGNLIELLKELVAVVLLAALVLFLIWLANRVPVVDWSWATKECVRVVPSEAGTCDQLPKRYESVWVQ